MGSETTKTPGAPTCVTARRCVMMRPDKTAEQDNVFRQFLLMAGCPEQLRDTGASDH